MSEHERLTVGGGEDYDEPFWKRKKSRIIVSAVVVIVILVVVIVVSVVVTNNNKKEKESDNLWESLKTPNILQHLSTFDEIARNATYKSRSVVDGFNASADYVITQLSHNTDYEIAKQHFVVPVYLQLSPPTLAQVSPISVSYVLGVDFSGTRYGGNGTYHVQNVPANVIGDFGCDPANDYVNYTTGHIAVVFDGGNCTQYEKALIAEAAGAPAALIVNRAGSSLANWRVRSVGWTPGTPLVQIPILGITYSIGNALRQQQNDTGSLTYFDLTVNTTVTIEETFNVLARTKTGHADRIMVVGAHLDGVPEGPGINDNASGSSSVLEIALQLHRAKLELQNKILFVFWGAEEIGLLGSRYFVDQLSNPSNPLGYNHNNTILNLNFDMLGSPNFVRYVYNASTIADPSASARSVKIQKLFEDYFNSQKLEFIGATMSGGSDYFPFVEAGIPAGALATGAGEIKSVTNRDRFGGMANTPLDPCYHLYCDTYANINSEVLDQMSKAAAYATQHLAQQHNLAEYLSS